MTHIRRALRERGHTHRFRTEMRVQQGMVLEGGTRTVGGREEYIYLGGIAFTLRGFAYRLGVELKEAHLSDEVITTIIHEDLHRIIYELQPEGGTRAAEEALIRMVTESVMEDLREERALYRAGPNNRATFD